MNLHKTRETNIIHLAEQHSRWWAICAVALAYLSVFPERAQHKTFTAFRFGYRLSPQEMVERFFFPSVYLFVPGLFGLSVWSLSQKSCFKLKKKKITHLAFIIVTNYTVQVFFFPPEGYFPRCLRLLNY